jgi:G3E family GTPase
MGYQEPEYLPWDGRRVPLTFVAGYLGAGKTTLINELLASATRPIAVLVNDVGEINIDARLIRRRHGDTIELTDGCVCCSLSEGFGAAFDQLRSREVPPEHVVIELSGIADPSRVLPWSRSAGFRLDGVVTVVDVAHFSERLAHEVSGPAVVNQLKAADIVFATKIDLAEEGDALDVRTQLSLMAGGAPVVSAAEATLATLLDLGGGRSVAGDNEHFALEPTLFDPHKTSLVPLPVPIDRADIEALLDGLGSSVVRAKGIALNAEGRLLLIQVVGSRREITRPTDLVVISTGP